MNLVAIGEALVDMLIKTDAETGKALGEYQRFAGGAPANVAVAAAKLGGKSILLSRIGADHFGDFVLNTLNQFQVNTQHVVRDSERKTALAFVILDENGERAFDFYLDNTAHTAMNFTDYPDCVFEQPVIAHLCSGSVASDSLALGTYQGIEKFRQNKSIVSLDINYRHAFWQDTTQAPAAIDKLAQCVDVIKASKEELIALYTEQEMSAVVQNWLQHQARLVIVTDGGNPIEYYAAEINGTVATPTTEVIDTTAAGDAFIGGFLHQVAQHNQSIDTFHAWAQSWASDANRLRKIIEFAARCGAFAVSQYGAYISLPTNNDISAI